LSDQSPHIEGGSKFDRASSCACPTLDAYIELEILDKSFRINFHKEKISNVKVQISKEIQNSNDKWII
jgi:hypothetical protein